MVLPRRTERKLVERLFQKAKGWNRIAKAARGNSRWRAYREKKRALERLREIRPDAVRIDGLSWKDAESLVIGVSVAGCGRLHLVLRREDHRPGGPWDALPYEV